MTAIVLNSSNFDFSETSWSSKCTDFMVKQIVFEFSNVGVKFNNKNINIKGCFVFFFNGNFKDHLKIPTEDLHRFCMPILNEDVDLFLEDGLHIDKCKYYKYKNALVEVLKNMFFSYVTPQECFEHRLRLRIKDLNTRLYHAKRERDIAQDKMDAAQALIEETNLYLAE